jgi:hypothetical protein
VRLSPLGTASSVWPIVPDPDDRWWWMWSSRWNENWQGKPKYSEKTCPGETLSTTNPTSPDLGSNPGHRCGKPATNRLRYVTTSSLHIFRQSWVTLSSTHWWVLSSGDVTPCGPVEGQWRYSETPVNIHWTTRRHIIEIKILHSHSYENRYNKHSKSLTSIRRCGMWRRVGST